MSFRNSGSNGRFSLDIMMMTIEKWQRRYAGSSEQGRKGKASHRRCQVIWTLESGGIGGSRMKCTATSVHITYYFNGVGTQNNSVTLK